MKNLFFVSFFMLIFLSGCAMLQSLPEKTSLDQRLESFPKVAQDIKEPVTVYWSEHAIPFIEAQNEEDLAYGLGMVHAHLRLAQMELIRRVFQGRLSEMASFLSVDIDKLIRTIDFGKKADEIYANLPPDTQVWLTRYVAGINAYIDSLEKLPHEFVLAGLEKQPWTVKDVITIGRGVGTDINWLIWFPFLMLPDSPEKQAMWDQFKRIGADTMVSFDSSTTGLSLLESYAAKGSNSLAVAPEKSKTGAAIMANDPHLGIMVPNTWVIVGLKSPDLHAVGFSVPGLPFIGVGRNPDISWGGTNMRSRSSDLFFVKEDDYLPAEKETIGMRWWFDRTYEKKSLKEGVYISDIPFLEKAKLPPVGMRWMGHEISDEFTAFLKANKAKGWQDFVKAFEHYAVSGQNMLYADKEGNIGQVLAVRIPRRGAESSEKLILEKSVVDQSWSDLYNALTLPSVFNPKSGFVASSNNKPTDSGPPISDFFSPSDRVERITQLVKSMDKLGFDEIRQIQTDVYSPSSFLVKKQLCHMYDSLQITQERATLKSLCTWDGHYTPDSENAVIFQLVFSHAALGLYTELYGKESASRMRSSSYLPHQFLEDIKRYPKLKAKPLLEDALKSAKKGREPFKKWGDMHRLEVRHVFSNIPLIGGRYLFQDLPAYGSNETLAKTAHNVTNERHRTRYGANSRHISFMHDMDENYFVLLGGQDGWLKSEQFLDQVSLWMEGGYIRVPLRMETVRKEFGRKTVLTPTN